MSDKKNILMISRGDELFQGLSADTVRRHEDYAQAAGAHIWMVCLTGNGSYSAITRRELTAIPTNSTNKAYLYSDAVRTAGEIAYKNKIDLIVAQDPFLCGLVALRLKSRFKAPLQIQDHSCFYSAQEFKSEKWFRGAMLTVGRRALRRADHVRAVNASEANALQALGVPQERLQIQPVPLHLDAFLRRHTPTELARFQDELGLDPKRRTLLWIGRPSPEKNFNLFEEGFQALLKKRDAYQAVVVGFEREPKSHLHFLGVRPYADLPRLYQSSDALVSTSRYEGYGRVYAEALLSGTPALSTKTAGYLQVVPDELQETFDAAPEALAEAVIAHFDAFDRNDFLRRQRAFQESFPGYEQSVYAITQVWQRLMDTEITEREAV